MGPIECSNWPLHHGALDRLNFHVILSLLEKLWNFSSLLIQIAHLVPEWTKNKQNKLAPYLTKSWQFFKGKFSYFFERWYPIVCSYIWYWDRKSPVYGFLMCNPNNFFPLTMTLLVNRLDNFPEFCLCIHIFPLYFELSSDSVELFTAL